MRVYISVRILCSFRTTSATGFQLIVDCGREMWMTGAGVAKNWDRLTIMKLLEISRLHCAKTDAEWVQYMFPIGNKWDMKGFFIHFLVIDVCHHWDLNMPQIVIGPSWSWLNDADLHCLYDNEEVVCTLTFSVYIRMSLLHLCLLISCGIGTIRRQKQC